MLTGQMSKETPPDPNKNPAGVTLGCLVFHRDIHRRIFDWTEYSCPVAKKWYTLDLLWHCETSAKICAIA